ncbi:MAG: hypothetical protein ACYS30_23535, partial [Planctomycetota bacterium]
TILYHIQQKKSTKYRRIQRYPTFAYKVIFGFLTAFSKGKSVEISESGGAAPDGPTACIRFLARLREVLIRQIYWTILLTLVQD